MLKILSPYCEKISVIICTVSRCCNEISVVIFVTDKQCENYDTAKIGTAFLSTVLKIMTGKKQSRAIKGEKTRVKNSLEIFLYFEDNLLVIMLLSKTSFDKKNKTLR
jgi:hypothetical protein